MSGSPRLAPGESSKRVDTETVAKNVYRGGFWELVGIGKPLPALTMGFLLLLLLVFAVTGLPWPSIVSSAALIGVAIWAQRGVRRWADEHNARVAPAIGGTDRPKPKAAGRTTRPAGRSANGRRDRRRP